jgi:hypothetical protein
LEAYTCYWFEVIWKSLSYVTKLSVTTLPIPYIYTATLTSLSLKSGSAMRPDHAYLSRSHLGRSRVQLCSQRGVAGHGRAG